MKRPSTGRNVIPLTPRQEVEEAASHWMTRIDAGLDPAESMELEAWLDQSAAHRDALDELSRTWDRLESLKLLSELFPHPKPPRRNPSRVGLSIAATVLIVMTGVFVYDDTRDPAVEITRSGGSDRALNDNGSFETPMGGRTTVILNDGSRLTLNTLTRVRTVFTPSERAVHLMAGEIHLRVASDTERPLRVYVGDRLVEAVGTEFNVQLDRDDQVEVIVTEGKVLVSSPGSTTAYRTTAHKKDSAVARSGMVTTARATVPIVAGQRAFVHDRVANVEEVPKELIEAAISWREGHLIFRGESLEEVLHEVARYTPLRFDIQDKAARDTRVVGLYRAGDADTLLETLKANFAIDYRKAADGTLVIFTRLVPQQGT